MCIGSSELDNLNDSSYYSLAYQIISTVTILAFVSVSSLFKDENKVRIGISIMVSSARPRISNMHCSYFSIRRKILFRSLCLTEVYKQLFSRMLIFVIFITCNFPKMPYDVTKFAFSTFNNTCHILRRVATRKTLS